MADPVIRIVLAASAVMAMGGAAATALPDPTRPPLAASASTGAAAASAPVPEPFLLQSIVFGPTRRLAVINGRQVHEGSALGEARVLQIKREAVLLEIQGRPTMLSLYPGGAHGAPNAIVRRSAEAGIGSHD